MVYSSLLSHLEITITDEDRLDWLRKTYTGWYLLDTKAQDAVLELSRTHGMRAAIKWGEPGHSYQVES